LLCGALCVSSIAFLTLFFNLSSSRSFNSRWWMI
jgi:hypothetical protein